MTRIIMPPSRVRIRSVDYVRWEGSSLYVAPFDPKYGPIVRIPVQLRKDIVGYVAVSPEDEDLARSFRWSPNPTPNNHRKFATTYSAKSRPIYAARWETHNGHTQIIYLHREILGLPRIWDGIHVANHRDKHTFDLRRPAMNVITLPDNVWEGRRRRFYR